MSCGHGLEEQAAHFLLFFDKDFKVLIDDGHSQQDTSTTANGTLRERERLGGGIDENLIQQYNQGYTMYDTTMMVICYHGN